MLIGVRLLPADIDECALMPQLCRNGQCLNTLGSFTCQCPTGFFYQQSLHICQDVDECLEPRPPCFGGAKCENTRGSFRCVCPVGYKLAASQRSCVGQCQFRQFS